MRPSDLAAGDVYHLLTGLVIPRPIAWISTYGPDGIRNLAPHSYFTLVAHDPPHVVFSAVTQNDTLRNVRHGREFVINIPTSELVEALNFTATDFPPDEDEFAWAGLTEAASHAVRAPRVAEAPAHLECRFVEEISAGNGNVLLAEVVHLHVGARIRRHGRVDPGLLDPIARLGGTTFGRLGERFELPRPSWADVRGTAPGDEMPRRGHHGTQHI